MLGVKLEFVSSVAIFYLEVVVPQLWEADQAPLNPLKLRFVALENRQCPDFPLKNLVF